MPRVSDKATGGWHVHRSHRMPKPKRGNRHNLVAKLEAEATRLANTPGPVSPSPKPLKAPPAKDKEDDRIDVRAYKRRRRVPKVQDLPEIKFSGFDNPIDVWGQQFKQEAMDVYAGHHILSHGTEPGSFTSSLKPFKESFARLAAAGLVSVEEHPVQWTPPTDDSWEKPILRQTATVTDLGLLHYLEDDGRTTAEAYDDWKSGGPDMPKEAASTPAEPLQHPMDAWNNILATLPEVVPGEAGL